jgi:hypothetical protein
MEKLTAQHYFRIFMHREAGGGTPFQDCISTEKPMAQHHLAICLYGEANGATSFQDFGCTEMLTARHHFRILALGDPNGVRQYPNASSAFHWQLLLSWPSNDTTGTYNKRLSSWLNLHETFLLISSTH